MLVTRSMQLQRTPFSAPIGKTDVPSDVIVKARQMPRRRSVDRNSTGVQEFRSSGVQEFRKASQRDDARENFRSNWLRADLAVAEEYPTGKRVKILEETRAHWTSLFQRSIPTG